MCPKARSHRHHHCTADREAAPTRTHNNTTWLSSWMLSAACATHMFWCCALHWAWTHVAACKSHNTNTEPRAEPTENHSGITCCKPSDWYSMQQRFHCRLVAYCTGRKTVSSTHRSKKEQCCWITVRFGLARFGELPCSSEM